MKKELIGLLFLLVLVGSISAAPEIQSVEGNISDGQNITLSSTGSNFGNGAVPLIWDDFDDRNDGYDSYREVGDSLYTGDGWTVSGTYKPVYDNTVPRVINSKHLRAVLNTTSTVRPVYYDSGTDHSEWYASFWVRMAGDNSFSHVKTARFEYAYLANPVSSILVDKVGSSRRGEAGSGEYFYTTGDCLPVIGAASKSWSKYPSNNLETWIRIEGWTVESTFETEPYTYDGYIKIDANFDDGNGFVTVDERQTKTNSDGYTHHYRIFTIESYVKNPVGETTVDYDDVYVATSRARVEIGNNQNFSLCTHREIQIPQQWSDGSITFNVNQGSFSDGETAYVFVVDENGIASEGYPIIIGEQGSLSAPVIQSVSGNLTHGENVTIQGGGFGTIGPTIYKWDDFEGGTNGAEISNGWYLSADKATYTEANPRNGSSLCVYNSNGGQDLIYNNKPEEMESVFVTLWSRTTRSCTPDVNCGAYNNKWINICDPSPIVGGGSNWDPLVVVEEIYESVTPRFGLRDDSGNNDLPTITDYLSLSSRRVSGAWERYELFLTKSEVGTGTGIAKLWGQIGGEGNSFTLLADHQNVDTQSTNSTGWLGVDIGMMAQVADPMWWDDIYIADSRARVEVGNNQNFSLCTHREIQIPQQWADGSITFNVNQGSFSDGETAYVFVVDENGNVSTGRQITFSGESNETNQTIYATPHIQDYITLQEMLGSVEDYKRGLTPIEQVVANIKKFIWG